MYLNFRRNAALYQDMGLSTKFKSLKNMFYFFAIIKRLYYHHVLSTMTPLPEVKVYWALKPHPDH